MSDKKLAIVVLAAGMGTRTRLPTPKVLLPLCGAPMLSYVLETAGSFDTERIALVLHHGIHEIATVLKDEISNYGCLVQDQGEPLGTGHAVQKGLECLDAKSENGRFVGNVLVLYGDSPLIGRDALNELVHAVEAGAAAAVLSTQELSPAGLGRIVRDDGGQFLAIREEADCAPEELEIHEVNTGFCCFDGEALRACLPRLSNENNQGEIYLTDCFGLLKAEGKDVALVQTEDPEEVMGVNDLAQLSTARAVIQEGILYGHLLNGVLIEDPASAIIERDVKIGRGTRILPHVVIRNGVEIGEDCEVGPFSHLRVGAVLENGAEVGNFVEMKKSTLGAGSKAKHLTYLGDASIGRKVNIGAGTITANYDGKNKHRTTIEDAAFIGSGTIIVAPATVGEGALTGAGALVTRGTEVAKGSVVIGVPARPLDRSPRGETKGEEES